MADTVTDKGDKGDPMGRRAAMLAEIDASRTEKLRAELAPPTDEPEPERDSVPGTESVDEPGTESVDEPVAEQETETTSTRGSGPDLSDGDAGGAAEALSPEPLVDVVVDGVRRQVRQSDLVAAYQFDSAARNRLQEAATTLRRAQEYEQSVRAQPPAESAATDDEPDEPYVDIVKAIQFGDPAEAGKSLKSFIKSRQSGSASAADHAQIAERVVMRALDEREWNDARATFDKEYQDIKVDPDLAQIAGPFLVTQVTLALQAAQQRGERRAPYLAILRDAGNRLRSKLVNGGDSSGQAKANQTGPHVSVDPARAAMKRTMPQPPAARGVSRPLGDSVPLDADKAINAARQKSIDEIIASRARRSEMT